MKITFKIAEGVVEIEEAGSNDMYAVMQAIQELLPQMKLARVTMTKADPTPAPRSDEQTP